MSRIQDLFETLEGRGTFAKLEREVTKDCEERLKHFQGQLSVKEYEQMRDAAFSASCLAEKLAFEIGFQTAFELVFECQKAAGSKDFDHF